MLALLWLNSFRRLLSWAVFGHRVDLLSRTCKTEQSWRFKLDLLVYDVFFPVDISLGLPAWIIRSTAIKGLQEVIIILLLTAEWSWLVPHVSLRYFRNGCLFVSSRERIKHSSGLLYEKADINSKSYQQSIHDWGVTRELIVIMAPTRAAIRLGFAKHSSFQSILLK